MIKHNMVTSDMVLEALGLSEYKEGGQLKNVTFDTKEIADKLNDLIAERCPYCEEGMRGCHCWNDE